MKNALLVVWLTWGLAGYAAQQQTQQAVNLPSAQAAQGVPADQRGTSAVPLVIKVIPAPEDKTKAEADAQREKDKTDIDKGMLSLNRDMRNITIAISVLAFCQLIAAV